MRSESISEIIRIASILSVAFPLISYVIKLKQASKPLHLIGGVVVVSALSDLIAVFFFSNGESTVLLFNGYYIILFLLLTWFFYNLLTSKMGRSTVLAGLSIYIGAFIFVSLYVQPFSEYQTLMWTITGMIMVIFSISYFVHLFSLPLPANNYGYVWINSGILYYFSMNLFLFIMSSYVLTKLEQPIALMIWSFHNVNNVLKNIIIGFGISTYSQE